MKKIVFLLLISSFARAQNRCPYGDEFTRTCTLGKWDACPDGYREGKNKKGENTCVCKFIPLSEDHPSVRRFEADIKKLKSSDSRQNQQIADLQKKDVVHDARLDDHERRIVDLESRPVASVEPRRAVEERVEVIKSPPPPPQQPPSKKGDPNLAPPTKAPEKTETVYWFRVAPEIGLSWESVKSPEYLSSSIWATEVGVELRIEPPTFHGGFIFLTPTWVYDLGKNYLPETTPSPFPTQATSRNGFLAKIGGGYKFVKFAEVFAGYSIPLTKGAEEHSGAIAGLEFGLEKIPIKLQFGTKYLHEFGFFGGVIARFPIKPQKSQG